MATPLEIESTVEVKIDLEQEETSSSQAGRIGRDADLGLCRTGDYLTHTPAMLTTAALIVLPVITFLILDDVVSGSVWDTAFWGGRNSAYKKSKKGYCEVRRHDHFIVEQANAWSNFGFIFSGAICLGLYVSDKSKRDQYQNTSSLYLKYPLWTLLTGVSFFFLGICSFLFHASLTSVSQTLDVAGIYVAMMALIAFQGARYSCFNSALVQYLFVAICLTLDILATVYKHSLSSGNVLPGSVGVLTFLVLAKYMYDRCRTPYRGRTDLNLWRHSGFWIFSICSFGLAYFLWTADRNRADWICSRNSWFQGHAAWHVLDSFSLMAMYLYGRSVNDIVVVTHVDVSFDGLLADENGMRSDSDVSTQSVESSFSSTRTRTSSSNSYQDIIV